MINQGNPGNNATEAGASERSGASVQTSHDAERSGEAPASVAASERGIEAKPRNRRKLSRPEQLRLVREYDAAPAGEKGLFLRRTGFYSSQISAWRRIRDDKFLNGAPKRGPKAKAVNPLAKELSDTQKQLRKASQRLEFLEKVIDVQKKISEITGIPLKAIDFAEED